MVLDIVPAIFDAYQKSGVTVVDQTENTEHFAKGTDLAKNYGLVILYFPAEELNETDIAVLQAYVDAGGRILMHGENPSAVPDENIVLSNAAKALGTSFTITDIADAEYDATINTASNLITNPGHEVTEVHPDYISKIEYSQPALWVMKTLTEGNPFLVDQAVSKGRITALSDLDWYANYYEEPAVVKDQNAVNLLFNLYADSVRNMDTVKAGKDPNAGFGEEPAPIPPATGDTRLPMLWLSLAVLAVGAALLLKRRAAR